MELDLTAETQFYLGLYEREVHRWLDKLSKGVASAVDIGAGAGEYSLYFLRRTAAENVFAFEPSDSRRQALRRNLTLNCLNSDSRLQVSDEFVGRERSQGAISLDSLFDRLRAPCLIKIDVDGGEMDILRGAERLLEKGIARWLIETHSADLESECERTLRAAGCWTAIVPNAWWRFFVPDQRPIAHNRWLVAAPENSA